MTKIQSESLQIEFNDNNFLSSLFGVGDSNIHLLEKLTYMLIKDHRCLEIVPERVAFGTAPTTVSTFCPPLKIISVGILLIPY